MIKPEQVEKDSAEVVIDKLLEMVGIDIEPEEARIIIAAALNAWPDAKPLLVVNGEPINILLPLTETHDD